MESFFPFFVDLEGREVLVVGGGRVAERKVGRLLSFGVRFCVVAPRVSERLRGMLPEGSEVWEREFCEGDVEGKFLVVVAVDRGEVEEEVYRVCRERGILCNLSGGWRRGCCVFPAISLSGGFLIGVSTGGLAPAVSGLVARYLGFFVQRRFGRLLEEYIRLRSSLPAGQERRERLRCLVEGWWEGLLGEGEDFLDGLDGGGVCFGEEGLEVDFVGRDEASG